MVGIYYQINRLLDAMLSPLEGLHPLAPLGLWSVIVGVAAMVIYKYTSHQAGIKTAKDRIKGHFYEVWLYIDDAPVIIRAQLAIMMNAGRYLAYALVPLAIMIVIFFPLFANFETRYAFRPLAKGEAALVEVRLAQGGEGWEDTVSLTLPAGLTQAAPPVRFVRKVMDAENIYKELGREYVAGFKLVPEKDGDYSLDFTAAGARLSVPLLAGGRYGRRVSPYESQDLATALLYPPKVNFPADSPISQVKISYPEADFPFLGWNTWWIWPFLIISMIAAYAVKGVLKVEI